ncbi:MAG: marine proteobacterial sortase target protein [endosymbiont of Galathealinum brachiosum]|uniref:Marine proteobacterial sortase target protein n=1 Tax=endosymbiont of Galathealinum brachiosum TaxID=2200906 RepID=A0A370DDL2_9GAMM|nr:MAG: marine proteobacterial sortase target protein [endosymbiont of Galathealinum brachiosum]
MLTINKHFFKRRPRREYLDDKYKPKKSGLAIWFQRLIMTVLLLALALFLLLLTNQVYANNATSELPQITLDKISEGSLVVKSANGNLYHQMPLLRTVVDMHVSGMISRNHVKQYFKNPNDSWIEAIYVFPLPENSAVDHMRMRIGNRIIEGEIKEKQEAKRLYKKAQKEGKKTALIEQQRPNLFTNQVANIGPGETIVIEIEYQQTLHYDQGNFSLRFPMAITPRYIPGKAINETIPLAESGWAHNTLQVPDASSITPFINNNKQKINPVSIKIDLKPGFPLENLFSRYHTINKHQTNDIIHISLTEGDTYSDRDFELVWTPESNHTPKAAVFNEKIKNNNFQMVMLVPPGGDKFSGQPLARDVTYIIDTSGSMYGVSMDQAKQSLLIALDRLRLHDKFNIIQFNSVTDQLFSNSKMASFQNILSAKNYVNNLHADGGTEMAPALKLALKNNHEKNYVHQVIFLTDGSVENETALFDIIHKSLGNSRLFTIGIGSAPNSYFMRKAAKFGRGSFTYISNVNEVHEKMSSLFAKLESPVMTDIQIHTEDNITTEVWPNRIPDLYHGEPVVLAIRSDKPLNEIIVSGTRALSPWSAKLQLNNSKPSNGIGAFWARNKISALSDSLHEGADKERVRSEIINIALTHHLVSKHTSLIAVDKTPARPNHSKFNTHQIPVNLPHGQSTKQSFGRLAQTATSAELNLLFGITLLMLALALTILLRSTENTLSGSSEKKVV